MSVPSSGSGIAEASPTSTLHRSPPRLMERVLSIAMPIRRWQFWSSSFYILDPELMRGAGGADAEGEKMTPDFLALLEADLT